MGPENEYDAKAISKGKTIVGELSNHRIRISRLFPELIVEHNKSLWWIREHFAVSGKRSPQGLQLKCKLVLTGWCPLFGWETQWLVTRSNSKISCFCLMFFWRGVESVEWTPDPSNYSCELKKICMCMRVCYKCFIYYLLQ